LDNSIIAASAERQLEQPSDVNNSTTANPESFFDSLLAGWLLRSVNKRKRNTRRNVYDNVIIGIMTLNFFV